MHRPRTLLSPYATVFPLWPNFSKDRIKSFPRKRTWRKGFVCHQLCCEEFLSPKYWNVSTSLRIYSSTFELSRSSLHIWRVLTTCFDTPCHRIGRSVGGICMTFRTYACVFITEWNFCDSFQGLSGNLLQQNFFFIISGV